MMFKMITSLSHYKVQTTFYEFVDDGQCIFVNGLKSLFDIDS